VSCQNLLVIYLNPVQEKEVLDKCNYICAAHWREIRKCGDHEANGGGNCGGGISADTC
jgi:hypothetical protein